MTLSTSLGLLLIGVALVALFLASNMSYSLQRLTRFHRRAFKVDLSDSAIARLFRRKKRYHADLTEIRDLIVNLQLAVSLEETLSGALLRTADQFAERGILGERLNRHVQSRLMISPEEVLRALAEDFDSEELRDMLRRLEMAREGGASSSEALRVTAEDLDDAISAEVEREIERAPIRLITPMGVGVFFPALILAAIPLLARLLENLRRF
jgi:tight adherence protein C